MNIELDYKKEREEKQEACEALWERYRPTIEGLVAESGNLTGENKAIVNAIVRNGFISHFRDHGDPDSPENKTNFDSFNFGDMSSILIRVAYLVAWEINDLVGVQPVAGHLDKIHALRYECNEEGRMNLVVASRQARPAKRDLDVGWTQECEYDLTSVYGLDIHAEINKAMSELIAQELFNEVVTDLLKIAREGTWANHKPGTPWEADDMAFDINRVSAQIAQITRRQFGNYIVCNKSVMDKLRTMAHFVEATPEQNRNYKSMKFVGTFNYKNFYEAACVPANIILVGGKAIRYNGMRNSTDTGYIFAPEALVGMRKLRPNELKPVESLPPQFFGNRQVTTQLTTSFDSCVEDRDWYRIIRL